MRSRRVWLVAAALVGAVLTGAVIAVLVKPEPQATPVAKPKAIPAAASLTIESLPTPAASPPAAPAIAGPRARLPRTVDRPVPRRPTITEPDPGPVTVTTTNSW